MDKIKRQLKFYLFSTPITDFSVLEREINSRGWNQLSDSDCSGIFIIKILLKIIEFYKGWNK